MRALKVGVGAAALAGSLVAAAAAQAPVPTVEVSVGRGSISVTPAGPIAAGPTRFEVSRRGRGSAEAYLATLRAGVSVGELRRTLRRDSERALGLVFLEGAAEVAGPPRSITVDLRPNVTYAAISVAGPASGLATFTTGERSGARAPRPDASVRMVDYGFRGPASLPRNGVIRVRNDGFAYHFALAFPVRPDASNRRVGRAFRGGSQRAIGQIVAGPPVSVQGLISPSTTNDNRVRFSRAGRYAFVCFFGEHNRLGMYRVFRVR